MRKIVLFTVIFGFIFISCKDNPKNNNNLKIEKYPILKNITKDLNIIFDYGYSFDEELKVNYIAIENIKNDTYQLILGLDKKSNYDMIESLRITSTFYAIHPEKFKEIKHQKKTTKKVSSLCHLYNLKGDIVIAYQFEILPKEFSRVRFHFYNDKGIVLNDKFMTVLDVVLPKLKES